jgi:hypothetical protein
MYGHQTSHSGIRKMPDWITSLTMDASDEEVRAFLAEWHAEEMRQICVTEADYEGKGT